MYVSKICTCDVRTYRIIKIKREEWGFKKGGTISQQNGNLKIGE